MSNKNTKTTTKKRSIDYNTENINFNQGTN